MRKQQSAAKYSFSRTQTQDTWKTKLEGLTRGAALWKLGGTRKAETTEEMETWNTAQQKEQNHLESSPQLSGKGFVTMNIG